MELSRKTHCGGCRSGLMNRGLYLYKKADIKCVMYICSLCDRVYGTLVELFGNTTADNSRNTLLGNYMELTKDQLHEQYDEIIEGSDDNKEKDTTD